MIDAEKKRFWELDFLRGFCVILMVIDHFFYSAMDILPSLWQWVGKEFWVGLNEFAIAYWTDMAHSVAHFVVVSIFFLICGISCTLSHSNLMRSLRAFGVAVGITLVTFFIEYMLAMDQIVIRFGVIHMLAAAMLFYWALSLLGGLVKRISPKPALQWLGRLLPAIVGAIVLIIFFTLPLGHFDIYRAFDGARYVELFSDVTIEGSEGFKKFVSIFVDIKNYSFASSDYFPILPYAAVVLVGGAIGEIMYCSKHKYALAKLDGKWNKPVTFVGKHAILVYILHQVVIIGAFFCVGGIYYLIS